MLATYYKLTKPGIVYGNALSAIAGFLLAAKGHSNFGLFMTMLVGISFIIAAACVVNNYIDRNIDAKMKRTQKRALVTGQIKTWQALSFAAVLFVIGTFCLAAINPLALGLAWLGFFFYVVMYGIWKRRSPFGTVVGSVSGAMPIVVGYCAVTNNFDLGAWLLFLAMVCWQMPHFYSVAIYRSEDYKSAGIPVLPLVKGKLITRYYSLLYIAAYIVVTSLLAVYGYASYIYLAVMLALGGYWLLRGLQGFSTADEDRWAQNMFGHSLTVLLGFCVMLSLNSFTRF